MKVEKSEAGSVCWRQKTWAAAEDEEEETLKKVES